MNAIGMIETKGLLAAVEGADSMLKAADVSFINKSSATGGLITITVTGEVAAVQTAVEVAATSICRLGSDFLVSKHVIARPNFALETIIPNTPPKILNEHEIDVEREAPSVAEPPVGSEPSMSKEINDNASELKTVEETPLKYNAYKLQRMKLNRLRDIANGLPEIKIKLDIENATKKELIKAICDSQIKKGHE